MMGEALDLLRQPAGVKRFDRVNNSRVNLAPVRVQQTRVGNLVR